MTALLEVRGLTKRFGGVTAVDGCSFDVPRGSITALIGPNGSGKTTLFNLVTGYLHPDAGSVAFDGWSGRPHPARLSRRGLTRTFQQPRIFRRLTLVENLTLAVPARPASFGRRDVGSTDRARAEQILDDFGLADLRENRAGELSYGQQKLLEFATTLMTDPKLVLLDEPTAGINPVMIERLEGHIRTLHGRGITFLVVEHDMNLVMRLCDPVVVMDHGAKLAEGGPQDVQRDPAVLDAYLGADPVTTQPLLTIQEMAAGYGRTEILRGVDLHVAEGSITCLIGPNGAGKSTVLKTVSGLLRPTRGTITLRDKPIGGLSPQAILGLGVVHVPQERSLFPAMSVWDNLLMGGFIVRDRAVLVQRAEEVADRFPLVAERRHAHAGSLSGGEQKIVEIARALMLDPALLLMDEPSTGLEPRARHAVFETIRELNEVGRTVLLVEQNARSGLAIASHAAVMEGGVVRLEGSGSDLLHDPEVARLYLGTAGATTAGG